MAPDKKVWVIRKRDLELIQYLKINDWPNATEAKN
jgi:hypothetical protein